MNFLAHVYLATPTPEGWCGGLLGDFVKGTVPDDLPRPMGENILLHRRIDRFTDDHPVFRRSRALVRPDYRRYAGIMVDLFYDHFLASHWQRFSHRPLDRFTGEVYAALHQHRERFPPRLQRMLPYMIGDDWLGGYARLDGIERALQGLSRRLRRANPLADGIRELEAHYESFESQFLEFFPAAIVYAGKHLSAEPRQAAG